MPFHLPVTCFCLTIHFSFWFADPENKDCAARVDSPVMRESLAAPEITASPDPRARAENRASAVCLGTQEHLDLKVRSLVVLTMP